MSFDGNGTFSRPVSDYVFDTVISETDMNTEMNGIAAGLSNCITKDGQQTVTANIPMSSHKFTGLSAGSAAGDSATLGQIQAQAYIWCGTAGGTADALTVTSSPAITAYAAGQRFWFVAASANTGAATITVSGLATKDIQRNGAALVASDIVSGKVYEIVYDGTQFQLCPAQTAATLAGTETFTNKTLTSPTLTTPVLNGEVTGTGVGTDTGDLVKLEDVGGSPGLPSVDGSQLTNLPSTGLSAATQAEMEAATSTTVAVTPGRTRFHPGVCKMWINFNGTGTPAARGSYGFESITDNGTGNYTLGFDPDLADTNFFVSGSWAQGTENPGSVPANGFYPVEYAAGAVRVLTTLQGSNAVDASFVHVGVWGDQ